MLKEASFIQIEPNLELWIESLGESGNEACIFISGAGANSSFWSNRLCKELADNGFFVIKYDHRDFGYSTKVDFEKNPYDFMQLVKDAIALLDSLQIENAHVIGHSMGGFIAQLLAINYPERVLTITSASSSTNSPQVPLPPPKTWEMFLENDPQNDLKRDLPGFLKIWKYLNGTATFEEDLAIEYTRNLYKRQEIIGALGESHVKVQARLTDRSNQLKQVKIPTLIIHGEEDYLVDKFGGIQTADCIANSKLVLIPKMGHMLFNRNIRSRFEQEIIRFIRGNSLEASRIQ